MAIDLSHLARKLQKLTPSEAEQILKDVSDRVERRERLAGLKRDRQELVKKLVALDQEIARLEGTRARGAKRYRKGGRTRERNQPTLVERAVAQLSRAPGGKLRISELARRIVSAGHVTSSAPRTFQTAVYLAISRDPRIRRVSKGVYGLKSPAKSAEGAEPQ